MKISIKNFGPIAEAQEVELRPLTVFVGPSNTGKSYLAVLIYALLRSFQSREYVPLPLRERNRRKRHESGLLFDFGEAISDEVDDFLTRLTQEKVQTTNFFDLPEKLQKFFKEKMGQELALMFHQELPRCMGTSPKENLLITGKFFLHFEDNKKSFTLTSLNKADMEIKNFSFERGHFPRFMALPKAMPKESKADIFFDSLLEAFAASSDYFPHKAESFYLPAARTGIMQSHQAIVGSLIKRTPFAGLEDGTTLSGIVSDFLEEIISMDTSQKAEDKVSTIADDMEKEILKGFIKTKPFEAIQYPQFLYKQNGLEIPLLCSSSMVSELAPVVLFIRHRVKKDDLLIIEEPEAHLHPEAQRNMAAVVVRLIRAGVRVMVTTHSDYFLDQISNYVRRSKFSESERSRLPGSQDGFLDESEIGAYVFNRRDSGTIVEKLHFEQENGLSSADHDKVSSDLYNETVGILEQFDQQNNEG